MNQAGQKAFQALPIAYSAITIKQSEQMSSAQRDTHCTDTLVKFAIPQFLLLVKEAAHELALPLPLDLETKIFLTSLGTGTDSVVARLET